MGGGGGGFKAKDKAVPTTVIDLAVLSPPVGGQLSLTDHKG